MIYYVNCIGKCGQKEREFSNYDEAKEYYRRCIEESEWNHIEITKQIKAYLPLTGEEFN